MISTTAPRYAAVAPDLTDFFISLASRSWRVGEFSKTRSRQEYWKAACAAYRVVGRRNGDTERLCQQIKVYNPRANKWQPASADTVEHLAKAYDVFLYIWTWDKQKAWEARKTFPYTRFHLLSEAMRQYEFSPSDAYDFLFQVNAKNEYLGGRGMMAFITNTLDERPEWERNLTPLLALTNKFLTDYEQAPESLLAKIREVKEEIRKWQAERVEKAGA